MTEEYPHPESLTTKLKEKQAEKDVRKTERQDALDNPYNHPPDKVRTLDKDIMINNQEINTLADQIKKIQGPSPQGGA